MGQRDIRRYAFSAETFNVPGHPAVMRQERRNVRCGSISEVGASNGEVRSSPRNGHRQATPTCPFRAITGSDLLDHFVGAREQRRRHGEAQLFRCF